MAYRQPKTARNQDLLVQSWPSFDAHISGRQQQHADAMPPSPDPDSDTLHTEHLTARESFAHGRGNAAGANVSNEHQDAVEDDAEDIQYNLRPRSLRSRKKVEEEIFDEGSSDSDEDGSDKLGEQQDSPRKGKRKVGRPIAYQGDIHSPHLTEAERRRLKRRVDNRESARRVRNKRQNFLQEISNKIASIRTSNASLKAQIAKDQAESRKMEAEIAAARMQFAQAEEEGAKLRRELGMLQSHIKGAPMDALQRTSSQNAGNQPPFPLSLSRVNTLSLSMFGSGNLPSLLQLTNQHSKELPFSDFIQMHRQNSQRPLPDMGGLGEIQGLTGLQPLAHDSHKQSRTASPKPGKE